MAIANSKVQALVIRIDKLEKQNRRFKQLAFAAFIVPALLLLVLLSSVAAPAQAPAHQEPSGLDQGQVNQLLAKAEETNAKLTALAATQNLNVALNKMYDAFHAPNSVYKDDYNAQYHALVTPEFLKSIGAVTTDPATGKQIPNWEMAKELGDYITAAAPYPRGVQSAAVADVQLSVDSLQRDVDILKPSVSLLEMDVDHLKKFRDDICSSFKMSDKPHSCLAF